MRILSSSTIANLYCGSLYTKPYMTLMILCPTRYCSVSNDIYIALCCICNFVYAKTAVVRCVCNNQENYTDQGTSFISPDCISSILDEFEVW